MEKIKGIIAVPSELADRLAIQDVIFNHSRGLDRLNSECLKNCYWPEAEVDYGSYKGSAHQFAELVVDALASQYQLTHHSLGNTLVEIRGDIALVETYVNASHLLRSASEEMVFSGRYLDRLQRRGDRWKILHRQVVMDWSRRHPQVDERNSESFAAMAKGAHRTDDPLHLFLAGA